MVSVCAITIDAILLDDACLIVSDSLTPPSVISIFESLIKLKANTECRVVLYTCTHNTGQVHVRVLIRVSLKKWRLPIHLPDAYMYMYNLRLLFVPAIR